MDGTETFDIEGLGNELVPQGMLNMRARNADGSQVYFRASLLLNSAVEVNYYHNSGILQAVLLRMLTQGFGITTDIIVF